jgi:hypothetical protein
MLTLFSDKTEFMKLPIFNHFRDSRSSKALSFVCSNDTSDSRDFDTAEADTDTEPAVSRDPGPCVESSIISVYPLNRATREIGKILAGIYRKTVDNWKISRLSGVSVVSVLRVDRAGLGVKIHFNSWYPSSPAKAARAKDPTIARAEMSTDRSL